MYIEIINEEFDPWQKLVDYKKSQLKDRNNIGACSVFLGTMSCLLYTSPSPRDAHESRMPSSA